MKDKKATNPRWGSAVPITREPIEGIAGDPLLAIQGLTEDQRRFLGVLAEIGMPYLASKETRKRYGIPVTVNLVREWRKDPLFSDLYETIRREYWDEFAVQGVGMVDQLGGRVTSGAANLRIQQLNRAIPEEYLPPIVQQVHQSITYQAEGEFQQDEKPVLTPAPTATEKTH